MYVNARACASVSFIWHFTAGLPSAEKLNAHLAISSLKNDKPSLMKKVKMEKFERKSAKRI
jgi:hypothetical protein